jgi:hypothetical protein
MTLTTFVNPKQEAVSAGGEDFEPLEKKQADVSDANLALIVAAGIAAFATDLRGQERLNIASAMKAPDFPTSVQYV